MGVVEASHSALHGAHVLRRADFLGKQQMQRLDLAQNDGGDRGAGPGVEVHREIDVGPQTLATDLHCSRPA